MACTILVGDAGVFDAEVNVFLAVRFSPQGDMEEAALCS